jgi:hypothetical protein
MTNEQNAAIEAVRNAFDAAKRLGLTDNQITEAVKNTPSQVVMSASGMRSLSDSNPSDLTPASSSGEDTLRTPLKSKI